VTRGPPSLSSRADQTQSRQLAYPGHLDIEVVVTVCGKELTLAAALTTARYNLSRPGSLWSVHVLRSQVTPSQSFWTNEECSRFQEAVLRELLLLASQIAQCCTDKPFGEWYRVGPSPIVDIYLSIKLVGNSSLSPLPLLATMKWAQILSWPIKSRDGYV
jgi:hypothetical protein